MKYDAVILDFDGPVCDVFAGYPAHEVARKVRERFEIESHHDDPLAYIVDAANESALQTAIHNFISAEELAAVETATPTPTIRHFLTAVPLPKAVASNNSSEAIQKWLEIHNLQDSIDHICGRQPATMKPNPTSLLACAKALRVKVGRCAFIGDSESDAAAAAAANIPFFGLANGPNKRVRLIAYPHVKVSETNRTATFIASLLTSEF